MLRTPWSQWGAGSVISSGAPSYDTDAAAWFAAVVTAGGTVSTPRKIAVNSLIIALKADGSWALSDDFWLFRGAESAIQSLVSLKGLRTATAVGSPTFNANGSYTFNGTSSYINTGWIASTMATQMTGTDQGIGILEDTNVNSNTSSMGLFVSGTDNLRLCTRTGTTILGTLNSGSATFSITTGVGYSSIDRSGGATTMSGYKDGVKGTDFTGLTVGTALPNIALYIGARNNAGTADLFRASTASFARAGKSLGATIQAAHYATLKNAFGL